MLAKIQVVGEWDERRNMREEECICRHHLDSLRTPRVGSLALSS